MKKVPRILFWISIFFGINTSSYAQLNVTSNQTAVQLVQKLLGAGVSVSNEVLICDSTQQSGVFTAINTNLGVDSGIVLTSGSCISTTTMTGVSGAPTLSASNSTTYNYSDSDLANLVNTTPLSIKDACKLEFDFVPTGDTVKFDYVFGSDEYPTYNCSNYNDVFGFFISGPGITGKQNIALVPGTNIPVAINSVNNGSNINSNCTSMGTGSPFTQYYVTNNGTTVTYNGFTTVFTAIAPTIPCSTYHIKLAIADKTDQILDSGVFLEAGSLTSNGVQVSNSTASLSNPVDYIVEGCMPVKVKFDVAVPKPYPITLDLNWSGSATNGTDYPMQANTFTIPPNTSSDSLVFNTFSDGVLEGLETITLKIYNNTSCSYTLLDSITYYINDSLILDYSPLTDTICPGDTTMLVAGSDSSVNISWSPGFSMSNPNADTTYAFPSNSTTYTLVATYGSCPLETVQIPIEVLNYLKADAGLEDTICVGAPLQLNGTTSPSSVNFSYEWSPGSELNDSTLSDPIYTPLTQGLKSLTFSGITDSGCVVRDTVDILVIPNSFTLHNQDTAICKGGSVNMRVSGSPLWEYNWTPKKYLNDTTITEPTATPDTSVGYFITGNYPGCLPVTRFVAIDVQPNPIVQLGVDREVCDYDTVHLASKVSPANYPFYSYSWTPGGAFYNNTLPDAVFRPYQNSTTAILTVTTPAGCSGSDDVEIVTHPSDFLNKEEVDTGFCMPASFQVGLSGGQSYSWSPTRFLSDPTIADPVITPIESISYLIVSGSDEGCMDTAIVQVEAYDKAVVELGEDITLYDGETARIDARGNASYFHWSPGTFLDDTDLSSVLVQGLNTSTQYIVSARTEKGCEASDTISVFYDDGIILEMPTAFDPRQGPLTIIKRGDWNLDSYRIYNRWGELIFETQDEFVGWDGTYQSATQPVGNYVYDIQATKPNGQKLNKTGNILLIK